MYAILWHVCVLNCLSPFSLGEGGKHEKTAWLGRDHERCIKCSKGKLNPQQSINVFLQGSQSKSVPLAVSFTRAWAFLPHARTSAPLTWLLAIYHHGPPFQRSQQKQLTGPFRSSGRLEVIGSEKWNRKSARCH